MEKIDHLPAKTGVIGPREIIKALQSGKIKKAVVAKNCPDAIITKLQAAGAEISIFSGDQRELGTRLGKPFEVAVVGYE